MSDSSSTRTSCLIAGGLAGVGCVVVVGGLGAALAFGVGFGSVSRGSGPTPPGATTPTTWPTSTEPENFPEAPPALSSDITVTRKNEPYVVSGASAQEIRSNLNRLGPVSEQGRHDAMTYWYIRWSYPFERRADSCDTGPVKVSVSIRMQMPQWSPPADAASDVSESWNRYLRALEHHENGHVNHGLQAAREVLEQLQRLDAKESCPAMDLAANAAANRILEDYRQRDKAYDQRTRHGATQGARFP